MRDNDVRYGKKRAHKKDLARRHAVADMEWEAEENDPLSLIHWKPSRVNL